MLAAKPQLTSVRGARCESADGCALALTWETRVAASAASQAAVRHDVPVDAYRRYFEENPELFAALALVAIMAVLGGLAGSVIGAKIKANGGRDQNDGSANSAASAWTVPS